MIYTSYFGKANYISKVFENVHFASIARFTPDNFNGYRLNIYAPDVSYFKLSDDEFDKKYTKEVLDKLNLDKVKDTLDGMNIHTKDNLPIYESNTDNLVLLCYEKDENNCHRKLLRQKFNELGIFTKEFQITNL